MRNEVKTLERMTVRRRRCILLYISDREAGVIYSSFFLPCDGSGWWLSSASCWAQYPRYHTLTHPSSIPKTAKSSDHTDREEGHVDPHVHSRSRETLVDWSGVSLVEALALHNGVSVRDAETRTQFISESPGIASSGGSYSRSVHERVKHVDYVYVYVYVSLEMRYEVSPSHRD